MFLKRWTDAALMLQSCKRVIEGSVTASGALETDLSSKLSICFLVCVCIFTSVIYLFLFFMAVMAQLLRAVQSSCTLTFTLE